MIDIKEKIGNYALDVSKYVLTGVLIASFFKDFGEDLGVLSYLIGLTISALAFALSYYFYKQSNSKKNKNE